MKITDSAQPRWEVPDQIIPRATDKSHQLPSKHTQALVQEAPYVLSIADSDLTFTLNNTTPFTFTFTHRSAKDNQTLFDTPAPGIVFKDQYLEISSSLPGNNGSWLYSLGEHTKRQFRLNAGDMYTLWNSDIPAATVDQPLNGGLTHSTWMLDPLGLHTEYYSIAMAWT